MGWGDPFSHGPTQVPDRAADIWAWSVYWGLGPKPGAVPKASTSFLSWVRLQHPLLNDFLHPRRSQQWGQRTKQATSAPQMPQGGNSQIS